MFCVKKIIAVLGLALAGAQADELRVAIHLDPKTFDPQLADDDASNTVRYLTAGVLVRLDRATQRIVPSLAESWTVTDGGKQVRFKLRKTARFSDGSSVTPEVVVASLKRLFDPAEHSPIADGFGEKPTEIKALDANHSVVITFAKPVVDVLSLFDEVAIVPAQGTALHAATSGMYTVEDYRPGEYVLLRRNPYFWNQTKPQGPEEIRLTIQKVREVEVSRFLEGNIDIINAIDPDGFERIRGREPRSAFDAGASFDEDFMWFNLRPGSPIAGYKKQWFAEKEFRNAVSLAINRSDLARIAYRSLAQPATGPVSPSNAFWFDQKLQPRRYDREASLAKLQRIGFTLHNGHLLDREGHAVAFSIMTNAGNRPREMAASLIQQDLKKIGIDVTVTTLDFPSLLERMTRNFDYEACLLGFSNSGIEPMTQMNVWLSSAENHEWNPAQTTPATPWEAEIDALMKKQATSANSKERKAAFDRVQEIVYDQEPFIYLVNKHSLAAVSSRVQGAKVVNVWPQAFWNIERLSVVR